MQNIVVSKRTLFLLTTLTDESLLIFLADLFLLFLLVWIVLLLLSFPCGILLGGVLKNPVKFKLNDGLLRLQQDLHLVKTKDAVVLLKSVNLGYLVLEPLHSSIVLTNLLLYVFISCYQIQLFVGQVNVTHKQSEALLQFFR